MIIKREGASTVAVYVNSNLTVWLREIPPKTHFIKVKNLNDAEQLENFLAYHVIAIQKKEKVIKIKLCHKIFLIKMKWHMECVFWLLQR